MAAARLPKRLCGIQRCSPFTDGKVLVEGEREGGGVLPEIREMVEQYEYRVSTAAARWYGVCGRYPPVTDCQPLRHAVSYLSSVRHACDASRKP